MVTGLEEGVETVNRSYLMRNDDVMTISAILFFVLFTFVLYRSRMVFMYKINTFFSSRQIYASNEVNVSKREIADIMLLIVIGCISTSIILYADIPNHATSRYGLLSLLALGCAVLICFKGILYSVVNWTFFSVSQGNAWLSSFLFSVAIVSALVFPLSLLRMFCVDMFINITHCLIGIIILQKIVLLCKLYAHFRPKKYGGLLFFLYFCSVEIMPTLIAWQLMSRFVDYHIS